MLKLVFGVKRHAFRDNDPRAALADSEYKAKRPGALKRQRHKCAHCDHVSLVHNQIHHANDRHDDNSDENLVCNCELCHPYHHVGELSQRSASESEGTGKQSLVALIPEITPQDLNNIQRAIAFALNDPAEAPIARKILNKLATRASEVRAGWGTAAPADFALVMTKLTDEEYRNREDNLEGLRLVFSPDLLKNFGAKWKDDVASMPVASWEKIAASVFIDRK